MRALAIGGVPATGKTTLAREVIKLIKPTSKFKSELLRGYIKNDIAILGVYKKNDIFGGTDKLSMAVQSDYENFVKLKKYHIFFEGDRLFTEKILLNLCENYETRIIILEQKEKELKLRHKKRNDTQSEKFLLSRKTKIENIKRNGALGKRVEYYHLNEMTETQNLAKTLANYMLFSKSL